MRRHENDLPAEHQAGAAGAGASVHAPGLQLRPPAARRRQATQGRTLQPPHQDRARGQAGAKLGWRGESDSCFVSYLHIISQMKMEGSSAPSSSSNHVVLERLNGAKGDKKIDAGDLPSLGEDDIHNVIGSCN